MTRLQRRDDVLMACLNHIQMEESVQLALCTVFLLICPCDFEWLLQMSELQYECIDEGVDEGVDECIDEGVDEDVDEGVDGRLDGSFQLGCLMALQRSQHACTVTARMQYQPRKAVRKA